MGVSGHLGIAVSEYDRRIRTFIPHYSEMLDEASRLIDRNVRTIVDLGVGTGALAARCLSRAPRARLIGIDLDRDMLALARVRLGGRAELICRDFLRVPLPRADAMVASFALHHVRTTTSKGRFYRRALSALQPGGVLVAADCHPAADRLLADAQFLAWRLHLRKSYPASRASALLRSWGREDRYVPLESEVALLRRGGFDVEVVWRREAFAVLRARFRRARRH